MVNARDIGYGKISIKAIEAIIRIQIGLIYPEKYQRNVMSEVVSGACVVSKLSGMVHIREDETPLVIEWIAIDQLKKVTIPLSKLFNLQASKETTPKLMLKLYYKVIDAATNEEKDKDIKLTFSNRPTMNNIKDTLQAILARLRTTIKDTPTPTPTATPTPIPTNTTSALASTSASTSATTTNTAGVVNSNSTSAPINPPVNGSNGGGPSGFDFTTSKSLSDENLLKNHQLQQKLLFEDKALRDKFTQAVINFKLSPTTFWQSRLNQLRTFALTISQHRGPYNVLSTIKPVATSDNQVNVNVTRDTIREIFETYPIIKKLFDDLVPAKFPEGEFWSRFFNSKLFRRLRGDRINNSNERGDVVLDKYLYVDQDFIEQEEERKKRKLDSDAPIKDEKKTIMDHDSSKKQKRDVSDHKVNKFIDLVSNEDDNSQKLGNKPDITMRYGDANISNLLNSKNKREIGHSSVGAGVENEMMVLLRNMNRLSEKMVAATEKQQQQSTQSQSQTQTQKDSELKENGKNQGHDEEDNEFAGELDLNDLNEIKEVQYVKLNINPRSSSHTIIQEDTPEIVTSPAILKSFIQSNKFNNTESDLTDTFATKKPDIEKTSLEINSLIKHNFRTFRLANINSGNNNNHTGYNGIIPHSTMSEIITIHVTSMELLSHFWRGFLSGDQSQAAQTRKILISLKKCQQQFEAIENKCIELIKQFTTEEKTRDKLINELKECLSCDRNGLERASKEYGQALVNSEKQQIIA